MPTPTPEQLAHVVTHAELLLMLSLRRLEVALDADPDDLPPPSAEALAAAETAALAELARQQQQWLAEAGGALPQGGAADPVLAAPAELPLADVDLGAEIDEALSRAYADLPERVQTLQGVDASALAPALAALPLDLPPLTRPLDAGGLTAWLDLHDAGDEAVARLVSEAIALAGRPQ